MGTPEIGGNGATQRLVWSIDTALKIQPGKP